MAAWPGRGGAPSTVNKGFPKFGVTQESSHITALRKYNLPDLVLRLVARQCKSELQERGRIDERLQSMNKEAIETLYRTFVSGEFDEAGRFATYRFYAYVSSTHHRCEVIINESIPGMSGKNHKVPIAVKSNGVYIAIAFNKATGRPVSRTDMARMHEVAYDIKRGDHGTQLGEATYCSSVGFREEAMTEIARISKIKGKSLDGAIAFRAANFENNIFSTVSC
ncbi:MAG: hypothetical protein EB824_02410 [Thaumarchaeota archaeon S15]|nr:MAG: hypothetical protein EB833_04415 [Thaumarchaeota archaeon S13]RNJ74969.1 MAG: hypothetical protein EB824_02410 [Thaumarchaeota archaeon S15]